MKSIHHWCKPPDRQPRLWVRRFVTLAAGLVAAATMASCTASSRSSVGSAPVASARSCAFSTAPSGPVTISLDAAGVAGSHLVTAPLCIDGRGPFPFVIDTGQSVTTLSPTLVNRLHLQSSGSISLGASSCRSDAPEVSVASWSVGGLSLAAQQVASAPMPNLGLGGQVVDGLLGSDVLGRFSVIRVDYHTDRLTLVAPEAAPPKLPTLIPGKPGRSFSPTLVVGTPRAVIPLTVVESPTGTLASASATFGNHGALDLVVDSGEPDSAVGTNVARSMHLAPAGSVGPSGGVGCPPTVPQYRSGGWAVGSLPLASTALNAVGYATVAGQATAGTIGADVLAGDGSFVLDYRSAQLILGST